MRVWVCVCVRARVCVLHMCHKLCQQCAVSQYLIQRMQLFLKALCLRPHLQGGRAGRWNIDTPHFSLTRLSFALLFLLQANLTTCFSGMCAVADFADESEQTGAFASLEGHAYRGSDAAPEDLQGEKQILTMRTSTNHRFCRCSSKIH